MPEISAKLQDLSDRFYQLMDHLEAKEKKEKIARLEIEVQRAGFWNNPEEAGRISQELDSLRDELEESSQLEAELAGVVEMEELVESDGSLLSEWEEKYQALERKIEQAETKKFLGGKYDKGNAILSIYSGAGGEDAQDWAAMLLRMYERYCQNEGFKAKILTQSFGQGVGPENRIGLKSVSLEIQGKYAYGFLKRETGVHRLVRISPFSAKQLRHTSFVLVEVLPDISQQEAVIEIKPDDLKIETCRSSGPGGQNVNKRETAVRIVHLPTGIATTCQTERNQATNKEKALKMLYAKLYLLKEEESRQELKEIKGEQISASWGNQIRSYVLHPYKLIKDLRTDVEVSNVDDVLDGKLDKFIEAEIIRPSTK
ncbi:MAG: peptide chain release factor 2 [bacterium]